MGGKQTEKERATHGILSNLGFMVREQWTFEKKLVFVWFLRILSDLFVSLLGIYSPKVVLDSISYLPYYNKKLWSSQGYFIKN